MRRSVAEFLSLLSLWPEGSLLGIKLQSIDFRIWEESLWGLKVDWNLGWDLRCVGFRKYCAQRGTILKLGFKS